MQRVAAQVVGDEVRRLVSSLCGTAFATISLRRKLLAKDNRLGSVHPVNLEN